MRVEDGFILIGLHLIELVPLSVDTTSILSGHSSVTLYLDTPSVLAQQTIYRLPVTLQLTIY
jgi:hypothetical protein